MKREDQFKHLKKLNRESLQGGGEKRIKAQHAKGKLTARERIDLLVDEGSFVEIDRFVKHRSKDFGMDKQRIAGDGVVTGYGYVNGRMIYLFSQDFTVFGGSLSESFAEDHDIPIIPQIINIGGASYLEGIEITYDTFLEKLSAATELPKTAAPPPDLFADAYERFADSGEAIVCVLPSAIVSGTVRSATVGLQLAFERGVREDLDVTRSR